VIWSFEHGGWWRPHRMGYTAYLHLAGRYTKYEAEKIVFKANRYSRTLKEVAVPEAVAGESQPSYTCPICGWRSYNLHDIAERYCGHCHGWDDR
jgi:hypothetical protein